MISHSLQQQVRQELYHRGFSVVRFTQPPLEKEGRLFQTWLKRGFAGEMDYLNRRAEERLEPQRLLNRLKTLIVLAHPYDTRLENTQDPQRGNISRYAWGEDYHEVLGEKLKSFQAWLEGLFPGADFYRSVDAQPVLEKAWAAKAGLGWVGKHTNIINRDIGSYFFISTILTDLVFSPDPQEEDHCGSCTSCLEVCPTGAFVAPYVLDARLCISYLTIELKGPIPRNLRPLIGNRIFGCDDCQEVCPWNRFSVITNEERFFPQKGVRNQSLEDLLQITPKEFKDRFSNSPISRAKWRGFIRNILVALGNSGCQYLAHSVQEKLDESEPLIRGHAVWAYERLLGKASHPKLKTMRKNEKDPFVQEEIENALNKATN